MASRKLESVPVSGEQTYSIYLQVTASKGTGNTFPCFLLQTVPCSLSGQVTGSHLFLRLLVPLAGSKGSLRRLREGPVAPKGRQGHLRPAGHSAGSWGYTEHTKEVGTPSRPQSNILSEGTGH